ncbi:hypothetical protein JOE58_002835 [Curtobacterium luteum]|uniref:Uncharacterized protein n=1 Tax=Curtobacterium luteum TaxID=33881 RepID=A0ABS2S0D9_9MICO|nr:hypothetical protein [Curtobacterium luteum]MBM7803584.1 hypothetical protein [Curtobacterium luteum]
MGARPRRAADRWGPRRDDRRDRRGIARSWDLLEPAITAAIEAEPPVSGAPIRLALSTLGSDAVALGAAAQVRDVVFGAAPVV